MADGAPAHIKLQHADPTEAHSDQGLENLLLARRIITEADVALARQAQGGLNLSLREVLLARGALSERALQSVQAEHYALGQAAILNDTLPDPDLGALLPAADAIALGAVPWRRMGTAIIIATARPDLMTALRAQMPAQARLIFTLAPRAQILKLQLALYGAALARVAETRAPADHSCRTWHGSRIARWMVLGGLFIMALAVTAPKMAVAFIFGCAFFVFACNMALKIAAFIQTRQADRRAQYTATPTDRTTQAKPFLPVVTLLVPLYKEPEVTPILLSNLTKLTYPAERLDVILAIEADDTSTRSALARCNLPPWVRVVQVPQGYPRTKPRALNFALNFAKGSIVGIYDAEDRPDRDQIARITQHFANVPHDVACLQGRLDYYNSSHNALSRCFTVEYATWFRVILPGFQRLGLFVPLGGTTVFLRRDALEHIGAWDAHNVTEDAELGLRLARHGYRTEIVETTTFEEAAAAIPAWIRQRARWQKGHLMTWLAAMQRPRQLWHDLGTWRFIGVHVQLLCAMLGFAMAPLLWSILVKPFGVWHPLDTFLTPVHYGVLGMIMMVGFGISLALGIYATRAAHLRNVRFWAIMMEFYHILGTLSVWRAVVEMLVSPFFWHKTQHGQFGAANTPVDPSIIKVRGWPLALGAR